MKLIWRPEARRSLLDITDYIAERNPSAARRLRDAILRTADRLPDHPYLHRPGRVPGTREAVIHPTTILVDRVGESIEILAVLHTRREYP
ncbi:type II toxin-antitoxin system RelE/ParE family toxin [Sphingosinithalassobacter sp. CS137]|uniref:type II toxin-antitoxin system RelE/ParE family toxin n=1 Tax=Sphingosinithalassobacter sp. CS137 TaxID=2762748 RepID=UPI00165D8431|nr:type II toxin-antitoxin system RelE/ParE family toxin [Sphingosinithalassobacter sp. CS137]